MSGGTYSLMSAQNDRFLRNLFMAGFIYFQSFWKKSSERISPKKYFFFFIFRFDGWSGIIGFTSNKPTLYPLDSGDFVIQNNYNKSLFDSCIRLSRKNIGLVINLLSERFKLKNSGLMRIKSSEYVWTFGICDALILSIPYQFISGYVANIRFWYLPSSTNTSICRKISGLV